MAILVIHSRKFQTERPFPSSLPIPGVGSILREQGDALPGAAGLGVSVTAEAAEVGQVVEGWLEPGSRAGICGFWEQLAVQEISIAMAPFMFLLCPALAPLEAGAVEIDLALLQPLCLDFIPYSAPSSSLSVPSS